MQIRDSLIEQLKVDEGFRAEAYSDEDGWSIGYGHFSQEKPQATITESTAEILLRGDINIAVVDCHKVFDDFDSIDDSRQDALVNMAFNMGRTHLLGFPSMIAAVNARDWETAAAEAGLNSAGTCPSKWLVQTGDRAQRIIDALKG